jgi:hypothetical protein
MFCIADYIRPPPFSSSWFDTLYLWPVVRPMGIHLFCYTHGGERATSHDVVQDVFASIVKMYGLLHGNNPFFFSFTSF